MPLYQYAKLQAEAQEIRLMILQPGSFDEDVTFQIVHEPFHYPIEDVSASKRLTVQELQSTLPTDWVVRESLDGRYLFRHNAVGRTTWMHPIPNFDPNLYKVPMPRHTSHKLCYEALSYTWGTAGNAENAYVLSDRSLDHRTSMLLKQNLVGALRFLRLSDQPRTLWVDAICINQEDEDERNNQVKRMGLIFARAARVVVWLGLEDKNTECALPVLQYLGEQVEVMVDGARVNSPDAKEPEWYKRAHSLPYDVATWSALGAYFHRPWFSRVWVVQEIQLASLNSVIQCGRAYLSWQTLRKAMETLRAKSTLPQHLVLTLARTTLMSRIRRTRDEINLLLAHGRSLQCADPRDRVYAMLGLARGGFVNRVQPRYGLPVAEVYKEAFLAMLHTTQRLDLLLNCKMEGSFSDQISWSPNWERKNSTLSSTAECSASRISAARAHYLAPYTLEVVGKHCGRVSYVGQAATAAHEMTPEIIKTWMPKDVQRKYRNGPDTMLDAFVKVICSGNLRERVPNSGYWSIDTARKSVLALTDDPKSKIDTLDQMSLDYHWFINKTLFHTREGYIGMGFSEIEPDDFVSILLGCRYPMVLRRLPSGDFCVVGPCFVHGLMEGEGILGDLPQPWIPQYRNVGGSFALHFLNTLTQIISTDDPRTGPLPADWEPISGQLSADDPHECTHFRNKATGEIINHDPRLLPEMLIGQSVKLETLRLV